MMRDCTATSEGCISMLENVQKRLHGSNQLKLKLVQVAVQQLHGFRQGPAGPAFFIRTRKGTNKLWSVNCFF